jgi:hypothetical protein
VRIERSELQLAAQSSFAWEQVRIRQASPSPVQRHGSAPVREDYDLGGDPQGELYLMLLVARMMLGRDLPVVGGYAQAAAASPPPDAPPPRMRTIQVRAESQQVKFQAEGRVQTADGRTIDFSAHLTLSRKFVQVVTGESAANGRDPLILNFDGRGVRLLADRIRFDLDGDGEAESVPVVAPGSGILFADRNGDGIATDGRELFGPQSGNGFADLAAHDLDGNGWIDETDPVFGELRVWMHDGSYRLGDVGIGAIGTAHVTTPFDLRSNGLVGQIRATGIYLLDNGGAGTLSHVDLMV